MLIIAHFQRYRRCCKSFLSERFFFNLRLYVKLCGVTNIK